MYILITALFLLSIILCLIIPLSCMIVSFIKREDVKSMYKTVTICYVSLLAGLLCVSATMTLLTLYDK